jgi:hypothetical protein
MRDNYKVLQRLVWCVALIGLALLVMGTKACQEDYAIGTQAEGVNTATPTANGSQTATPTATRTGVSSGTPTATPTGSSAVATSTPTPTRTSSVVSQQLKSVNPFKDAVRSLSEEDPENTSVGSDLSGDVGDQKPSNWLGAAFASKGLAAADSDGDGFSDALETKKSSDPQESTSVPQVKIVARLSQRLRAIDSDADGLSNAEEKAKGTSPNTPDTDNDGCPDGAEFLSGSNLIDSRSTPNDSDGDCLSTAFERKHGISPEEADTDGDGLEDSAEIAVRANPKNADSDEDGIMDGKEVEIDSDPTIQDS